jgi:hypothetical protein
MNIDYKQQRLFEAKSPNMRAALTAEIKQLKLNAEDIETTAQGIVQSGSLILCSNCTFNPSPGFKPQP